MSRAIPVALEFVHDFNDMVSRYPTTDSVVGISGIALASRDFKPEYLHEMQRPWHTLRNFVEVCPLSFLKEPA